MSIKREIATILKQSARSFLLLGPRQTGKSTLIRSLHPDVEINFADEEVYVQYLKDPGMLKKVVRDKQTVFIDEVQRIPSVLNSVQYLLDQKTGVKFYLTGSSATKLRRGKANLLPGRVFTYHLGPFTPSELGKDFDVRKALQRGLLPEIYLEDTPQVWQKLLRSYSVTYLKEEIQAEALTRNLEGFSRFLEVVASRSGDFIDFSKFSSHAMIERTSAKRYFSTLCDTLIVHSIEAFTKSSKRRLIQHPRYYFFDVGVLNGLLGNFEVSADRVGMLFENLFLQAVTSQLSAMDQDYRISVYRTEAGAEVDFIVEMGKNVFAVEVKASKNIRAHDLSGLKSFRDFYGKKHRSLIVYLGEHAQELEGIRILPLEDAVMEISGKS